VVTVTSEERLRDDAADGLADEALATAGMAAAAEMAAASPDDELAAARAEAARNLDGWQRTQAEFANARKRFEKQRAEAYVNANADLVAKLLPLLDDFERALAAVPPSDQDDPWLAGVNLVYRKMVAVLEEMGVEPVPALGAPFDPNMHEALGQEPSDEYESGLVAREMRRGYRLGERVIRPSLVMVAE
jgi:molecular chaperone GrpE